MKQDVVKVDIRGILPASNSCALFVGNDKKVFVISVEPQMGRVIGDFLRAAPKERPLTHDLIGHLLLGLGASLDHVVINDVNDGTFFARILLRMANELGKKIIEVDARPSDSIVLALQHKRPIFVARKVYDAVDDQTEILEQVLKRQAEETNEGEAT